jgi:hypothetical protein
MCVAVERSFRHNPPIFPENAMARTTKRRTPRTDANGNVLEDFRGKYETEALAAAHGAGIPGFLLDPAGWNGDPNDLTGFFADQIYRVGEINWTRPDAIERLGDAIETMQAICRNLGVDPKAAIPYEMARFKRQLHEARERQTARQRGEAPAMPPGDDDLDLFGAPSGPDHDAHAHGLAQGHWKCLIPGADPLSRPQPQPQGVRVPWLPDEAYR